MSTGSRLLEELMPHNHKQGSVYPTYYDYGLEKLMVTGVLVKPVMFAKWVRLKFVNNLKYSITY